MNRSHQTEPISVLILLCFTLQMVIIISLNVTEQGLLCNAFKE